MKRYIILLGILFTWHIGRSQKIYFTQDFSSSTNVSDYFPTSATKQNNFNSIAVSGNATMGIVDGKLRFTKTNADGTNRSGFVKNTQFSGLPATGASFLKVSVEVTISGNNANVPTGFMFTLGEVTGAPGGPSLAVTHSNFYLNPTKNAGEFKVATPTQTADGTFSGTQTIVWYVNNSGSPAGYIDPTGNISTVGDDASDIWLVNENGMAVLAINEDPAYTPSIKLSSYKFSNNPNFTATIDIDNIVLNEEPVIAVPKIASVGTVPSIQVPEKTIQELLPLAKEVAVTYEDGTTGVAGITWSPKTVYNPFKMGTYTMVGKLIPANGTVNPLGLTVSSDVTVLEGFRLVNTFTPNGDGRNDTWIIPDLKCYKSATVEVYARDGKRLFYSTDPNVGWDGRNQSG
ncbi:T9SS type B sorting domain-containing protein, partial [Pedobacter sp. BS3]|uniref:T9SS type B sorting domain-containing protein n=1 Tax=Pedobacter sp. BS3 TaxID=2567937 RepID=UPI001659CF86